MRTLAVVLLFAFGALAQGTSGQPGSRTARGNFLRIPVYETPGTGLQTYFVDGSLGSDSNNCQASGASACLTIQGAINKIPKLLRDQVTVSIAAGTYAGFLVTGFTADNGVQQTTGGLLIDGALATSTLATGTATGTATAGSAGSGSTFGTLTDGAQTWTVNDLVGRFVTTSSPTNTTLPISSNTATVITVVGTWNAPTGATTYTILDPSVVVNTAVSQPATPFNAAGANRVAVYISGNTLFYNNAPLGLRNMRLANTLGTGIEVADASAIRVTTMQIRPTAAGANGLFIESNSLPTPPFIDVRLSDISLNSSGSGVVIGSGRFSSRNTIWRQAGSGAIAINMGNASAAFCGLAGFIASETRSFTSGILIANGNGSTIGAFTGNRIACSSSAGVGLMLGQVIGSSTASFAHADAASVTNTDIQTCGIAVQAVGGSTVDVTSMTGSVATTGFSSTLGGLISFSKAGVTLTSSGTEINLDNGAVTAAFSDVTAGSCIAGVATSSRVCGR